jgi:hypothetical protein
VAEDHEPIPTTPDPRPAKRPAPPLTNRQGIVWPGVPTPTTEKEHPAHARDHLS